MPSKAVSRTPTSPDPGIQRRAPGVAASPSSPREQLHELANALEGLKLHLYLLGQLNAAGEAREHVGAAQGYVDRASATLTRLRDTLTADTRDMNPTAHGRLRPERAIGRQTKKSTK